MGVAGLWPILKPAGQQRALPHLALIDGFEANANGKRGYRVGIDASIWFFHAQGGKEGENPDIRTLFFRCARLLSMPFLPIFVFDGPQRPAVKRGKRIVQGRNSLETSMRNMIKAFGFECRSAPGEAEAELAWLNTIGVIDAVLSDDVDTFLFGGKTVVRNPGSLLSSNRGQPLKNSGGREDKNQALVFTSADIESHPEIQLTRGGLILIGLLSGGDYDQNGLLNCGPKVAHGLARCGFGDTLMTATLELSREQLIDFLRTWRHEIRHELKTNSRGFFNRKNPSLAKSIPESFPDVDVLLSYVHPVTSASKERGEAVVEKAKTYWIREPDLGAIASICEQYFEWGVKETIVKRFRTVMWHGAVMRILRKAVLEADARRLGRQALHGTPMTPRKSKDGALSTTSFVGTPSKMIRQNFSSDPAQANLSSDKEDEYNPLILNIVSERRHASTDNVLEYRLEISPGLLVTLTEVGVTGTRVAVETMIGSDEEWTDEEGGGKGAAKAPVDPFSVQRLWLPASMLRIAEPGLVEEYEEARRLKAAKKANRGKGRAVGAGAKSKKAAVPPDENGSSKTKVPNAKAKTTKSSPIRPMFLEEEEEEEETPPSFSQTSVTNVFQSLQLVSPVGRTQRDDSDSDTPPPTTKVTKSKPKSTKTKTQATKSLFVEEETQTVAPAAQKNVKDFFSVSKTTTKTTGKTVSKGASKASAPAPPPALPPVTKISRVRDLFSEPTTTTTSSRAASSGSKTAQPAYKAKPFPLSRAMFMDNDDVFGTNSASTPVVKRVRKKSSNESVGPASGKSGPTSNALTKSPRKSKSQNSPRSQKIAPAAPLSSDEEDGWDGMTMGRSTSPSPTRRRPAAGTKAGAGSILPLKAQTRLPSRGAANSNLDDAVLIISSDDDGPPPRMKPLMNKERSGLIKPLMEVKARAPAVAKKVLRDSTRDRTGSAPHSAVEVIDLT